MHITIKRHLWSDDWKCTSMRLHCRTAMDFFYLVQPKLILGCLLCLLGWSNLSALKLFLLSHQPPHMGSMMMAQPTLMYTQPMVRPANPFGNNPGAQVRSIHIALSPVIAWVWSLKAEIEVSNEMRGKNPWWTVGPLYCETPQLLISCRIHAC